MLDQFYDVRHEGDVGQAVRLAAVRGQAALDRHARLAWARGAGSWGRCAPRQDSADNFPVPSHDANLPHCHEALRPPG